MSGPIFLSAGIPRSGSTWLFNALRLLLKKNYPGLYSCWIDEYDDAKGANADAVLIKLHIPHAEFASKARAIFTSNRDLRDIAISMSQAGWIENKQQWLEWVSGAREQHEYWQPISQLDLRYDDIVNKPAKCLRDISAVLFPEKKKGSFQEVRNKFLAMRLNRLSEASSSSIIQHEITLLHKDHRKAGGKSRWKTDLQSDIADEISKCHADWLERMGYNGG